MTRAEAEAEIRALLELVPPSERQIEALKVIGVLPGHITPRVVEFDEAAQKIREEFLLDEFAGRSLTGYRTSRYGAEAKVLAAWAYTDAVAMLAERRKLRGEGSEQK